MKKTILVLAAVAAVAAAVVIARRAREARLAAEAEEDAWPSTWPEEWAEVTVLPEASGSVEPPATRRRPAAKRTSDAVEPGTPEG